ncbi:M20 family metallo-hydrolase [Methanocaldococcus sp.]
MDVVELAKNLIKIKAVNPYFGGSGEKEKGEFVKNVILSLVKKYNIKNYELKEYNVIDKFGIERVNIVFKLNFNKDKTLHIISHLDTVPEGDLSLWETNPYEPVVKDGKIYGRGAEDNNKAIVSSLLLLEKVLKDKKGKYNLSLIFVSDEEAGSKYGLRYLLDNFEEEIFKKDDLIIVPDFGTPEGDYIEIGEKGILWIKFNFFGKQCHGSVPENGVNANIIAFDFSNKLYKSLYNKFSIKNDIFLPPYSTFEPTMVKNKVSNPNTIPGLVSVIFDCRILPDYNVEEILNYIDKFIHNYNYREELIYYDKNVDIKIKKEILKLEKPNYTKEDSLVVKELKKAIKEVLNVEPKLCGMGGGTVAAFLREKGYNVAVWGIGEETAHQPNEHIKIDSLIKMAEVFYYIIKEGDNEDNSK